MRVKISYGLDIKDVPLKVAELLSQTAIKTDKTATSLERISSQVDDVAEEDYLYLLKMLAKIKSEIVDIDQAITESQQILVGLNNYYNGEENVSDGRSTMDTSRNADEQTTDTGEG